LYRWIVSRLVEVAERPDLVKDIDTGMIYVVNDRETNEYNALKIRKASSDKMKQEVENLKSDIDDIKSMLTTLINK
jgi:hypothetical protein